MATADVLLIIDMQNGVCRYEDQTIGNLDHMIEEINKRIAEYASEKPRSYLSGTQTRI